MDSSNPATGNAFGGVLPLSRPFQFPEFGAGGKLSDAYHSQGNSQNPTTGPHYYDPDLQSQLYPKYGAAPHVGPFGGRIVRNGTVPVGAKLQLVQNTGIGMAQQAMADIASDDMSILLSANAALQRGNFESAEAVLGRPVTIEEISNRTITPTLRLNAQGQKIAVSLSNNSWLTGQIAPTPTSPTGPAPVAGAAAVSGPVIGAAVGAAPDVPPAPAGPPPPAPEAPAVAGFGDEKKDDDDAGGDDSAVALANFGIPAGASSDDLVRAISSMGALNSGSSSSVAPSSLADHFARIDHRSILGGDSDDEDDFVPGGDDDVDGEDMAGDIDPDYDDDEVKIPAAPGLVDDDYEAPDAAGLGASFTDVAHHAARQALSTAGDLASSGLHGLRRAASIGIGSAATGARSMAGAAMSRGADFLGSVREAAARRAEERKEREEKEMEHRYLARRESESLDAIRALPEPSRMVPRHYPDLSSGEESQSHFLDSVAASLGEAPPVYPVVSGSSSSAPAPIYSRDNFADLDSLGVPSAPAAPPIAPVVSRSARREESAAPSAGASSHRAEAHAPPSSTFRLGDLLTDLTNRRALRPVERVSDDDIKASTSSRANPFSSVGSPFLPSRPAYSGVPISRSARPPPVDALSAAMSGAADAIRGRRSAMGVDSDDGAGDSPFDIDSPSERSVAPVRRNARRAAAPRPGDFVGMRAHHSGDHGAGIGQLAVNMPKLLRQNVLSVRYRHNGRTVKGLPNRQVGGALRQQILNLAHGVPADMAELTDEDAHYLQHFHRRATPAGQRGHLKFRPIPNSGPLKSTVEHRIQVLMGELAAGNDTAGVILKQERELMALLHKALQRGTLTPQNYKLITQAYFSR